MSGDCQNCQRKLTLRQRFQLLLKSRTNPVRCDSCGEPLVLKFSFQFYAILVLAIGGASLAGALTGWAAKILMGAALLASLFIILYFAPIESLENQERAIKEELSLSSIKVYRIVLVVVAAVYSFIVLVFDNNILSAIAMIYAALHVTKTNSRPVVALMAALLSIFLLYLI